MNGTIITPQTNIPYIWNRRMPGSLRNGLIFAGLGEHTNTFEYKDISGYCNNGTLIGYADPSDGWVWSEELGRWSTRHDGTENTLNVNQCCL